MSGPRELWSVPGPAHHDYFQAMYSTIEESPFGLRFAGAIEQIPADTSGAVIHINWLSTHVYRSTNGIRRHVVDSIRHLDRLLGQHCHVVLSIHEPVTHDRAHPDEEAELNRCLIARASVVHVLSEATPARSAPYFDIPEDRMLFVPHPVFELSDAAREMGAQLRARLGVADDIELVSTAGVRRRYKELESVARAVRRRNEHGRRTLLVDAGDSLAYPKDRITCRLHASGAASVRARLPDSVFGGLIAASDLVGLGYSGGLNSGVLATAVGAATPAIVSSQMKIPELDKLGDEPFFDVDGGHAAIDAGMDRMLQPSAHATWRRFRDHARQRVSASQTSASFLESLAGLPAEVDDVLLQAPDPDFSHVADSPTRERFLMCRTMDLETAYVMALRIVTNSARDDGDAHLEFESLTGLVESLEPPPDPAADVRRLFELATDLGAIRSAVSSAHRLVDLAPEHAPAIVRAVTALSSSDPRIEVALVDLESRVGESTLDDPFAVEVASALAQLIEEETGE